MSSTASDLKKLEEEFQLVPNLNNDAGWFKAVYEIASKHLDFLQERFELAVVNCNGLVKNNSSDFFPFLGSLLR